MCCLKLLHRTNHLQWKYQIQQSMPGKHCQNNVNYLKYYPKEICHKIFKVQIKHNSILKKIIEEPYLRRMEMFNMKFLSYLSQKHYI